MRSVVRIVAIIVFLAGLALFAYSLYLTYAVGDFANKTTNVDLMDVVSLILIISGYAVMVRKKTVEKVRPT